MALKKTPGILFPSLLLLILLSGCRGRDSVSGASWVPGTGETPSPAVEVVSVEQGKLYNTIGSTGTVRGRNEARIVSTSQGMVMSFPVRLGQEVGEGDVILRLDDELASYAAEQARTGWEIARADLEVLSSLYERGNASRVDLERARSSERGARAAYDQSLRILEDRTVRSPMNGHIIWIDENASPGNYLNAGSMIALVADISGFTMILELGERQIGLVGPGARAEIHVQAAGASAFSGTVDAVAAGSGGTTATYQVELSFSAPSDSGIKPGMAARVVVETSLEKEALLVPGIALLKGSEERNEVFLLRDGYARLVPVEVLDRHGDFAAVGSGLKDGDRVIVSGTRRLMDRDPVRATEVSLVREGMQNR
ncbi:efflux RND transporter periplasmic adaptor subunit [Marispirochaeta aestuarii]|uniref:efflux RND transporter periplasmic adaptor subunit n=1 Tax=Marispirochaeta aestuarii TaxID=1963862 RepID=UPI0029C845D8|nr:efflux RND transporter periplasmic adaptor subunit [Marispirochaeta aestuarii]